MRAQHSAFDAVAAHARFSVCVSVYVFVYMCVCEVRVRIDDVRECLCTSTLHTLCCISVPELRHIRARSLHIWTLRFPDYNILICMHVNTVRVCVIRVYEESFRCVRAVVTSAVVVGWAN